MIKKNLNLSDDDEFRFIPAKSWEYWSAKKTTEDASRPDRKAKGGKVVEVKVPECYPVSVAGSFWEETKVTMETIKEGKNVYFKKSLLELLLRGEDIPWKNETLLQDAWSSYAFGKFGKAVSLLEVFSTDDPKKMLQEGNEQAWAFPVKELYTRLKLQEKSEALLEEKDKKGKEKTFQSFHNLKVWAFLAGRGGVRKLNEKAVTGPLNPIDTFVTRWRLSSPQVGYLDPKESLNIEN